MFCLTHMKSRTQTYVLDELIDATSAYSAVYKAHPQDSSELVVAKIAKEDKNEVFDNEQSLLEKLTHPHIIKLHDAGEDWGRRFLILEYGGQSLRKLQDARQHPWNNDGTIAFSDVAHLTLQILSALHYIHQQGMVHNDISLNNIIVQNDTAKLIDFNHHAGSGLPRERQNDLDNIGLIVYELITQRCLHDSNILEQQFCHIFDPMYNRFRLNYSAEELTHLLKRMMTP